MPLEAKKRFFIGVTNDQSDVHVELPRLQLFKLYEVRVNASTIYGTSLY